MEKVGIADLRWIGIEELLGCHSSVRGFDLPPVAALYWWTQDVEQLVELDNLASLEAITCPLERVFTGRAEPYFDVGVTVAARPVSASRFRKASQQWKADQSNLAVKWLSDWATLLQRPLYIGISKNLRDRIESHLQPDSRLRVYFQEAGIDYMACRLAYVPVPLPTVKSREFDVSEEDSGNPALELLESILIRMSMPFLNRKQD